ncbi:hypothetical protein [Natronobiforma cellulositropha]|nr:hypothetical protein [Natronobiforma cellulositropha]
MATNHESGDPTYRCPRCGGDVIRRFGSWECVDCTHVPLHGAD